MKYKIIWLGVLVLLQINLLNAQDTQTKSGKNGRFGIMTGVSMMSVRNTYAPPLGFEMIQPIAYQVGLHYTWKLDEAFDHRITAGYLMWWMGYGMNGSNNIGLFRREVSGDSYGFFTLGYDLEFKVFESSKKRLYLSLGPDVSYNQWGRDLNGGGSIWGGVNNEDYRINYFEFTSTAFPLYIGLNIEANISFDTRWIYWKFFGKYHYQFERSVYRTVAETIVLNQAPQFSYHVLTGNYFGVGLILQPSADLLHRYLEK